MFSASIAPSGNGNAWESSVLSIKANNWLGIKVPFFKCVCMICGWEWRHMLSFSPSEAVTGGFSPHLCAASNTPWDLQTHSCAPQYEFIVFPLQCLKCKICEWDFVTKGLISLSKFIISRDCWHSGEWVDSYQIMRIQVCHFEQ